MGCMGASGNVCGRGVSIHRMVRRLSSPRSAGRFERCFFLRARSIQGLRAVRSGGRARTSNVGDRPTAKPTAKPERPVRPTARPPDLPTALPLDRLTARPTVSTRGTSSGTQASGDRCAANAWVVRALGRAGGRSSGRRVVRADDRLGGRSVGRSVTRGDGRSCGRTVVGAVGRWSCRRSVGRTVERADCR